MEPSTPRPLGGGGRMRGGSATSASLLEAALEHGLPTSRCAFWGLAHVGTLVGRENSAHVRAAMGCLQTATLVKDMPEYAKAGDAEGSRFCGGKPKRTGCMALMPTTKNSRAKSQYRGVHNFHKALTGVSDCLS